MAAHKYPEVKVKYC